MPESFSIEGSFSVPYEYRIVFSENLFSKENSSLADELTRRSPASRALVFIDDGFLAKNVTLPDRILAYFAAHSDRISLAGPVFPVPGGEISKNEDAVYDRCVRALHDAKIDRHSYAVIIGGGAVLDAVGFAAATVHRGVRQIRIPTTVLSQNDAGVGVKNGIDFFRKKNFLGTFAPPDVVLNDFTLLKHLPLRAWRDGAAEAVKVALIRDGLFFDWLEAHAEQLSNAAPEPMKYLIRRCAELHFNHITTGGDPFERGSARPLDFGHWSAHKLEQMSKFKLSHGHAVALGMMIDVHYSQAIGLLPAESAQRILACLNRMGCAHPDVTRFTLSTSEEFEQLLSGIAEFQEHLGGNLSLTMLCAIGSSIEINQVDPALLRQCCERVLKA